MRSLCVEPWPTSMPSDSILLLSTRPTATVVQNLRLWDWVPGQRRRRSPSPSLYRYASITANRRWPGNSELTLERETHRHTHVRNRWMDNPARIRPWGGIGKISVALIKARIRGLVHLPTLGTHRQDNDALPKSLWQVGKLSVHCGRACLVIDAQNSLAFITDNILWGRVALCCVGE